MKKVAVYISKSKGINKEFEGAFTSIIEEEELKDNFKKSYRKSTAYMYQTLLKVIKQGQKSYKLKMLHQFLKNLLIRKNITYTELEKIEKVTARDAQILEMAAWFHHIGYIKDAENHEKLGAEIVKTFLLNMWSA